MASFNVAIKHVLKWEGGLVDHPADPGGLTNRGITWGVFKGYAHTVLGIDPTRENLVNLTETQASEIYRQVFWRNIKGDQINDQNIANALLDGHVNMGRNGIKLMQRECGAEADGIVGPKTIDAINKAAPLVLFQGYIDARKIYYQKLADRKPQMGVFLTGWINRIDDLRYT
jgi:lysozyme family protein